MLKLICVMGCQLLDIINIGSLQRSVKEDLNSHQTKQEKAKNYM